MMATSSAFIVNLPSINGEIEAGITIGVDASLPDEQKLPILYSAAKPANHEMIKLNAIIWAFNQLTDPDARRLLVNGVAAIIDLGMVREVANIPDGDWRKTTTSESQPKEVLDAIMKIITLDDMKRAATVAVATKANFWLMNHHTGQGAVAGYVKKVLDVFFRERISDQMVTAAHNLGHYTSTLFVLRVAAIEGLRDTNVVTVANGAGLKLSQDAKLRFQSMPAGTHRLAVSYESAKKLIRSVYAMYCPGVEEFINIPIVRNGIVASPVNYHIGASYLTGRVKADYNDTDMERYMGRLGTFITTLYKNSTLAKSPHLALTRVESYEDYDADFKSILIRIQQAQAAARGRLVETQIEEFQATPIDVINRLKSAFLSAPN